VIYGKRSNPPIEANCSKEKETGQRLTAGLASAQPYQPKKT